MPQSLTSSFDLMMADLSSFEDVFSFDDGYTYPSKVIDTVISNRRRLGGKLFLDRLLGLLHVEHGLTTALLMPTEMR